MCRLRAVYDTMADAIHTDAMTKTCPHCNQSGHTTRRSKHCGLHSQWLEESKKKEQERLKESSSKAKRDAKLKASLDAGSPECMINIALKEINFGDVWSSFKRGNALEEGSAFAEALKENKGGCTLVLAQRVFEALRGISQEVVKGFTSANGVVEFLTKYEVGVLEYMNQKKLPGYDFDTAILKNLSKLLTYQEAVRVGSRARARTHTYTHTHTYMHATQRTHARTHFYQHVLASTQQYECVVCICMHSCVRACVSRMF